MSLFGKILAVLNLAALLGFVYMAAADFQVRHAWAYANFRWDVALDGIPLDESDTDQQGRPRYVNMTEKVSDELFNDSSVRTQEDFLESRKQEMLRRIGDDSVKPGKVDKIVEVLAALAATPNEREAFLTSRINQNAANEQQLRGKLDTAFDKIKQTPESSGEKDYDAKRLAMGQALVAMLDLLPTDEEKKKRAEERAKPAAQQADPYADPVYRQTANALGVRMMSRALDLQAKQYLTMALNVGELRQRERVSFVYQHQTLLNLLQDREHQLREQKEKLTIVAEQAKQQLELAVKQEREVKDKKFDLDKKREATEKELVKLAAEQEKLHFVRLRLRDANQVNQKMEQAIRKLESELELENP